MVREWAYGIVREKEREREVGGGGREFDYIYVFDAHNLFTLCILLIKFANWKKSEFACLPHEEQDINMYINTDLCICVCVCP